MKRQVSVVLIVFLLLLSWLAVLPTRLTQALPSQANANVAFLQYSKDNNSNGAITATQYLTALGPVINDFWINSTTCGAVAQFSFNVSDLVTLSKGIFYNNQSGTNQTVILSGNGPTWANFTQTLPGSNDLLTFQFWVNDTNDVWTTTGIRTERIYTNGVSAYFNYLGQAIASLENANNWSQVDPYYAYVLQNNVSSLQSTIDACANDQEWELVLFYSAVCNKLWSTIPSDVQRDINWALGNYTMIGNSAVGHLPAELGELSGVSSAGNYFTVYDRFALYGYYYANQFWALSYNSTITSKWNITAAYTFFDTAVNYSLINNNGILAYNGLPLYIYSNETGQTYNDRFYDEDAETISAYILFAELLNVSDAMNKATYWWNYLVTHHWIASQGMFDYSDYGGKGFGIYECEAPFFLKIVSLLKYYFPTLSNWNDVLIDIGNRFLGNSWSSAQWLYYVVAHAPNSGNDQLRLENTLAAWEALMGLYTQLNSSDQTNMINMLEGTTSLAPAWALMLNTNLYNTTSHLFSQTATASTPSGDNVNYTAQAEILMFMEGIVPGSTSLAFPLEELDYEYTYDIDPYVLAFNVSPTARTITIPVVSAGTLTFQYGTSPITCYLAQSGVWSISFSGSWNMITSLTYVSSLPTNLIYFGVPSVPEFPSNMILPIFFLTMFITAVFLKKKRHNKCAVALARAIGSTVA